MGAVRCALLASQPRAEALEVRFHQGDVALAGRGFLLGEPFDRIQHEGPGADLAGEGFGEPRADERLEEDVADLLAAGRCAIAASSAGLGSDSGASPISAISVSR